MLLSKALGCYKYHYFKDRKQITTCSLSGGDTSQLLQISLFQRSKANHNWFFSFVTLIQLLQISLFQRSKANHNVSLIAFSFSSVVTNIIISKIESKSQHPNFHCIDRMCCYKYHYFKDRKQITTA